MQLMNQVSRPFIGIFVVVYFDYIFIYSRIRDIHLDHLCQVWLVLRKESPYANIKKCSFMTDQVIFLGFIISGEGVSADPKKIKTIVEWPEPKNIHDVHSFHDMVTFYH